MHFPHPFILPASPKYRVNRKYGSFLCRDLLDCNRLFQTEIRFLNFWCRDPLKHEEIYDDGIASDGIARTRKPWHMVVLELWRLNVRLKWRQTLRNFLRLLVLGKQILHLQFVCSIPTILPISPSPGNLHFFPISSKKRRRRREFWL